jgi:hypothetical protein
MRSMADCSAETPPRARISATPLAPGMLRATLAMSPIDLRHGYAVCIQHIDQTQLLDALV